MIQKTITRVLYVEDDEDDYILVRDMLRHIRNTNIYDVQWASSYQEAIQAFEEKKHDIYLLDYHLGHNDNSGLALLKEAKARKCAGPFIFLTGRGSHNVDLEAMNTGAADYLVKDDCSPVILERAVRYNLQHARNIDTINQAREQFQDFLDNASDLIHSIDQHGAFRFANNAWKEVFQYSSEEIESLRISDIIAPEMRLKHLTLLQDIFSGKLTGNQIIQTVFVTKDGRHIEVEGSINGRIQNDVVIETREIYHNVTEIRQMQRRELEHDLERKKITTMNRIIADLSHDLRTPLSVLNTSTYLLGKSDLNEKSLRYARNIEGQMLYIRQIMDRLHDLVNQQNPSPMRVEDINVVSLCDAIADRLELLFSEKGVSLIKEFHQEQALVNGDRLQIERAISNIVDNALQFTPRGGSVKITICAKNTDTLIAIEDTGIGITEADLPEVFDYFFRADRSRMSDGHYGLGLAVAKQVIELHHGTICLQSTFGLGTTFTIQLPLKTQ